MWKAPLRGFLLVLVVAGVAILSLGLWARYTIYDQDQFVEVVGGLSTDPVVQQMAIERTMSEIDRQIEERTASQALSPTIAITYQMFRPEDRGRDNGSAAITPMAADLDPGATRAARPADRSAQRQRYALSGPNRQ